MSNLLSRNRPTTKSSADTKIDVLKSSVQSVSSTVTGSVTLAADKYFENPLIVANLSGAATLTMPTSVQMVAVFNAYGAAKVGNGARFVIQNRSSGANTLTLAVGTGGTGIATLTVSQDVTRIYLVVLTNVTSGSETYDVRAFV